MRGQPCWSARSVKAVEVNGYTIEPRADLRGANLDRVDLYGANLDRADLDRAKLIEATVDEKTA